MISDHFQNGKFSDSAEIRNTLPSDFRRYLICNARNLRCKMRVNQLHAFSIVKQAIDTADVAIGVFPEPDSPDRHGFMIIKGNAALKQIIDSNDAKPLKITAIPCIELEQAAAARKVLGDGIDQTIRR